MWIVTKLLGLRRLLIDGDPRPERPAINFVGATVEDNAPENRTDVTFEATDIVNGATNLATPHKLVKRSVTGSASFGGVSVFEDVQVGGAGGITTTTLDCAEIALFEQGLQSDGDVVAPAHTLASDAPETRVQIGTPQGANWEPQADGVWNNLASATKLTIPLDLPHGARLTAVAVRYKGPAGHAAFPGGKPDMPVVDVRYYDTTSGADSILDQVDTSASAGAYAAEHTITVSGMAHIVDRESRRYHVEITSEGGANYISTGKVYWVTATWTRLAGSPVGQD